LTLNRTASLEVQGCVSERDPPSWRDLWRDAPGRRFVRRHERLRGRERGPAGRVLRGALGAVLVVVGLVFMPLPGPGFVGVLMGGALIAGESIRVARWLDRAELRVRGWLDR
jgi:hypothetical protein